MESLLAISIALLAGLLMTRVLKLTRLNLPDVTAFLIAGLLVGPYCLGKIGVPGLVAISRPPWKVRFEALKGESRQP